MQKKRHTASLMPYRLQEGKLSFYLQKRHAHVAVLPGMFGMFGGGIEGNETPEEGLRREIREELNYEPKQLRYFSRYESADVVVHVFLEEVGADFESQVTVLEGEYGTFLAVAELNRSKGVALMAQLAALQISHHLGEA